MTLQYTESSEPSDRFARLEARIRELETSEASLKHGNAYLQHQSDLYMSMINAIPDFIVHTDLYGKILFVNDAAVNTTGLRRNEIEGKNLLVFLAPDERKKAIYNTLFMLDEKPGLNEFMLVSKTGKKFPFEINGDVFLDNDNKPAGFIFVCRDFTLRRHAENTIKKMEERLASITASLPGIIFQYRAGNNDKDMLNYVSEQTGNLFGLNMTDMDELYHSFIDNIHDEDREGFLDSIVKSEKLAIPWNCVFRFIKPTGELKWFQGISVPSFHNNELIFNGIILDISDFKLAESMSMISEEKFSRVFMTVPDCVAITRLDDGYLIDVNTAFQQITGWSRDEAVGRLSRDINFWADLAERDYLRESLLDCGEVINREFKFNRKDGALRSGLYSARSIRIGNDACLVIVVQDITELKKIEGERLRLEHQLLQVQKMDAIGQLAGGVAHDFNNILGIIQGNISLMLLKTESEDDNYPRLQRIDESVRRGADLTKQLLGFARGGKYELKTISVNELIEKSIRFFLETRKDIETDLKLYAGVHPVEADAGQLEQVLLNLYINAAHAMPGGGKIFIESSNISVYGDNADSTGLKEGNYVKVSVSDNGTGMDNDTLKRIFEPFFTTKTHSGGTGLGLASAYGIIRNHNGIINAYSEPGHGTTFNIYMPSTYKQVVADEEDKGMDLVCGKGVILLVDDEQSIINTVTELLGALEYTVITALNGSDAISVFSEKKDFIDLIIMDMIMPGIKGTALLKKFREINPYVRVLLSSGYSMQDEIQKALENGCQGFIQKPYRLSDLAAMVHKILSM